MMSLRADYNFNIKTFTIDGKVFKAADRPRSYVVDTPLGKISPIRQHLVR